MSRRARAFTVLAVTTLAWVACGEPTAPLRQATYAFDLAGDVFRWPSYRLPVRFFADTRGNMRSLVDRAVHIWEGQFLYGEFSAVLVDDSTAADVIVIWSDSIPPDAPPDTGAPVLACDGVTTFTFDTLTGTSLARAVTTGIGVRLGPTYTASQVEACVRRITVHEIGHALGLLNHSPYTGDIMWTNDSASFPSASDRRTIEILYHTNPTIGPPPR